MEDFTGDGAEGRERRDQPKRRLEAGDVMEEVMTTQTVERRGRGETARCDSLIRLLEGERTQDRALIDRLLKMCERQALILGAARKVLGDTEYERLVRVTALDS